MENDILFKRATAIEEVKENLILFSDIMINGFQTITERVPSFTNSILSMQSGSRSGVGLGEKVTQAIGKEMQDHEFIKEYSNILSSLSSEQQKLITDKFFRNVKFKDLELGTTMRSSDGRVYKKLNEIYALIACLDESIDFDFYDYVKAKKIDLCISEEKKEITKIKDEVIAYIRPLLLQTEKTKNQMVCINIINLIPEPEKTKLLEFFKEHRDFTSYDYRRTSRALYTFAYLHPNINIDESLYKNQLEKSGNGWKKYLYEIQNKKILLTKEE